MDDQALRPQVSSADGEEVDLEKRLRRSSQWRRKPGDCDVLGASEESMCRRR